MDVEYISEYQGMRVFVLKCRNIGLLITNSVGISKELHLVD